MLLDPDERKFSALSHQEHQMVVFMEKRHYQEVAAIISQLPRTMQYDPAKIAVHFAEKFQKNNKNFNLPKFLTACGVVPPALTKAITP